MIPKRLRVSPRDFPKDAPVRARSPYFLMKTRESGLPYLRFGVIIPSAAVPTAVRRHQLKRWILSCSGSIPGAGKDILFVVTRAAGKAPKKELIASVERAIHPLTP